MAHGDPWTPALDEQLIELALAGKTPQEAAVIVDRSVKAVTLRLSQIAEDRSAWSNAIKLLKEAQNG